MKTKIILGIQILAGLLVIVFGLNGFLQFLQMPPANEQMAAFGTAVYKTKYIFPFMAIVEIITGISFLLNKYTSLMAVILFPFMLNALLAHLFLDMNGITPSAFIVFSLLIVMYKNKKAYELLFKA